MLEMAAGPAPVAAPPAIAAPSPVRRVVLVTGRSGAGMSTALKSLEDLGYEAVDNLPLALVAPMIDQCHETGRAIALGIDSRTRDFSAERLIGQIEGLRGRPGFDVRLAFLDCDDEVLLRRFTETRRRHPLAIDRPVSDGILLEKTLLAALRDAADPVFDTSLLTVHDLKRLLAGHFALESGPGLTVFVTSFSFRRGLPREADLVFDVRFLDNPHWNPALRPLTGLDEPVQRAVAVDPDFQPFMDSVTGLLTALLPRYNREGKSYLTIAVGCSGGRHRSVFVAERLARWLGTVSDRVGLRHRDLPPGT